jgi:hypothetical protein
MSTYYLINRIKFGEHLLQPGSLIDDTSEDATGIQAAGGILVASSDTIVAAAAAAAQSVKLKGGNEQAMDAIMLSAYTQSAIAAAATIDASEIGTGAVVEAKIGTGAVVEAKIGTGAVVEAKIGTGAVTADKIGAGAVTAAKLANGAGLAALLAAGLGNSLTVDNGDADPSILAADAVNARGALVVAVVTEALTTTAEFSIESVGGVVLLAVPTSAALGAVYVGAGNIPAHATDSAVIVDATVGATGEISVTIFALPSA